MVNYTPKRRLRERLAPYDLCFLDTGALIIHKKELPDLFRSKKYRDKIRITSSTVEEIKDQSLLRLLRNSHVKIVKVKRESNSPTWKSIEDAMKGTFKNRIASFFSPYLNEKKEFPESYRKRNKIIGRMSKYLDVINDIQRRDIRNREDLVKTLEKFSVSEADIGQVAEAEKILNRNGRKLRMGIVGKDDHLEKGIPKYVKKNGLKGLIRYVKVV